MTATSEAVLEVQVLYLWLYCTYGQHTGTHLLPLHDVDDSRLVDKAEREMIRNILMVS